MNRRPVTATYADPMVGTEPTRGQKAAATRARNKAKREAEEKGYAKLAEQEAADQAAVQVAKDAIDTTEDAPAPQRSLRLDEWRYMLDQLEELDNLLDAFGTLNAGAIDITVSNVRVRALHDGTGWSVEVLR